MILGAPPPHTHTPLLYPGINVAGYSWRDSSCPGPGHHKEPGWTAHCCPPQEGQHPLLGPFLPTCLSVPESCLEALAPEQTRRLHQCCLPGHAVSDRSDLIGAADRPYLDTISLSAVCFYLTAETPAIRCLLQGELSPLLSPLPHPSVVAIWGQQGALHRFPCPRRSCPRRATKTDQTLNWAEEHKGDRTSEHSWPPGTWSSAPHRCYLFPLVPCHFSICKCLLRAAPYL